MEITPAVLVDQGICPTCYDRDHEHCLYGDSTERMLFENDLFECMRIPNPRALGHAIISSKEHFKDMTEISEELCIEVFLFARKVMNAIRTVYGAESVYLCTMCDGPMNHFHVQMIPRYACEKRGSRNCVKERSTYLADNEKRDLLREILRISISG